VRSDFLKRLSIFCLIYVAAVILWGAFVRATGSGAGCGSHWPLCNGEIIPRIPKVQTLIELAHRVSSGLCLGFIGVLYYRVRKETHSPDLLRRAAFWSLVFVITEALVGAAIVLYEWVAHDTSYSRAISISLHLVNTFVLLASLTVTVLIAHSDPRVRFERYRPSQDRLLLIGVIGLIFVGATGALTALGDTLFPVGRSVVTDHFLIRLRSLHPFMALGLGTYLIVLASRFTGRFSKFHIASVIIAMAMGGLTIILKAPIVMQLIHLLCADLVWISFIALLVSIKAKSQPATLETGWLRP